jgi:predicted DNA-binding transcriptional regulator AlpA
MMKGREDSLAGPVLEATWTRKELEATFKISGRTIGRLVALGQFPAPFHVGRSCRWRAGDIQDYIRNRN